MSQKTRKTSFYKTTEVEKILPKYISRHGSVSGAVNFILLSMDTIYRRERRVLRDVFSQEEIYLMVNNALSTAYNPQHITDMVLHDTEDEIDATFDYFKVNRETLEEKLKNLTISQQYALVDWFMEMRGEEPAEAEN